MFFIISSDAEEKKPYVTRDIGPGEMGDLHATVIEAPVIKADQVMSKDHPEVSPGMVCVECHKVTDFDAVTNATGQYFLNCPQLPNDEVWRMIVDLLPGRERFVLTTVYNNEPTATVIDMVLDRDKKVLYAVCEKGTQKLAHIRKNPRICAISYKGWKLEDAKKNKNTKQEWMSVQIRGNAEVIPSDDPQFGELLAKYKLARLKPERAVLRFDMLRITPESIVYFNSNLISKKQSMYQKWERNK